jgi:NAD(P)-dependent dehydrogenase (short-subunit alcohol dehydrogenase family)
MGLGGTVAFVTGPAGGIGRAIARALARDRASIVIHGLGDLEETERSRAPRTRKFAVPSPMPIPKNLVRLIEAGANF